ncbi:hypothetical protein BD408DRAFT_430400 [Parasitella parasitica]|nr:hypothetical protein BD408DRAFT_430400 [Parasitella parasitica]
MPRRNSKNMIQQSDRQQKGNQAKQDKLPKMPLYKDRLNLLEAEGDNMICDGDSALSELSDDLEAEEDHHQKAALTCAEYLQQMFPLTFDIDKAIISTVPLTDKISVHSREVTYKGYYKTLGIVCACVTPLNKVDYFDEMNQHEWEMSEQLMPCRNMATCITHFKANQLTTKNSFWYFIKPYYPKGTLTQYWMNNRIQKTTIQPLYILQIAISLFSAIRDAHSLNIGLVDISMETLWLGMDGVAYFSGFKSSLSLQGGSKHDAGIQNSMQNEPSQKEEIEAKPELELWEFKSSKSVIEKPEPNGKFWIRDQIFRETLDKYTNRRERLTQGLIDRVISSPTPSSEPNYDVSKRILKMAVERKSAPFLKVKPFPKSSMGSIYGSTSKSMMPNGKRLQGGPNDDPLLEYLLPTNQDMYNWDQTVVSKNERIALKQEEIELTQAIVEAPTTLDLWHCIESEINREEYPKFYSGVLTKAIEHASKIDPYMALTIFEKAKQKSLTSYISGCTVQVYNAVLLLRWEVWRDINGMLDLAEEMTINGIEFDNNSRRIVRAVVQEVQSEGGYSNEDMDDGVLWNAEERRNCNILSELAGKWMISE